MKEKSSITLMALVFAIFHLIGIALAAEEIAEEIPIIHKVITIKPYEVLQPSTLTSPRGTTVIWINSSSFPIEIHFLDKKVMLACGSPVNFFTGKEGAYDTAKIPRGGTASLCFIQKGKFEYIVKTSRTLFLEYGKKERKESRGTILIK